MGDGTTERLKSNSLLSKESFEPSVTIPGAFLMSEMWISGVVAR
jgi:hypothetical protein